MFGLALRGYQRRVQRLTESVSQRGMTLWQAIFDFIESESPASRSRVFERFQYDDPQAVAAVLTDLTSSGLLSRSGSGELSLYTVTEDHERRALSQAQTLETTSTLLWLELCRTPDAALDEIASRLALAPERASAALAVLIERGHVVDSSTGRVVSPLVVPVGAEAGWEVAVFDHYQTMCIALGAKLSRGPRAKAGDTTGGQTLTFDIDDAHPYKSEVLALLEETRTRSDALWHRVQAHNAATPKSNRRRVAFYVGQVELPSEDAE